MSDHMSLVGTHAAGHWPLARPPRLPVDWPRSAPSSERLPVLPQPPPLSPL